METNEYYKPKTGLELGRLIKDSFDRGETDLNYIDTSLITDMSGLFINNNQDFDVSKWNVENVKDMCHMFEYCQNFNCDISGWKVSGVKYMYRMFHGCSVFNQDIGKWQLGSDTLDIRGILWNCPKFNQDLSKWNLRNYRHLLYDGKSFMKCPNLRNSQKPKYLYLYGICIKAKD